MSASNSAVWLLEAGGQFVVKEAPLPTPGPDEVLIKNKAVAINPSESTRVTSLHAFMGAC